eukprot:10516972-Heterocapsa_arctica.AAC.1
MVSTTALCHDSVGAAPARLTTTALLKTTNSTYTTNDYTSCPRHKIVGAATAHLRPAPAEPNSVAH